MWQINVLPSFAIFQLHLSICIGISQFASKPALSLLSCMKMFVRPFDLLSTPWCWWKPILVYCLFSRGLSGLKGSQGRQSVPTLLVFLLQPETPQQGDQNFCCCNRSDECLFGQLLRPEWPLCENAICLVSRSVFRQARKQSSFLLCLVVPVGVTSCFPWSATRN